ncbi:MAG: GTP-binding protein, partial [Thermoplasmata archaeon]|nr:GTP-binding protein [Thermoplasmata archaeon]
LLGEGAVGKTSLLRRYVHDTFDDKYIKSIGAKVTKKVIVLPEQDTQVTLTIYDILGQMTSEKLQASYIRGAAGALLVCDLTRHETLEKLDDWIRVIDRVLGPTPTILLGNKSDLTDQIQISDDELNNLTDSLGGTFFHTSAKTGLNVENAFELLTKNMLSVGGMEPEQAPVEAVLPEARPEEASVSQSQASTWMGLPQKEQKKAKKKLQKFIRFLDRESDKGRMSGIEYISSIHQKEIELGLRPPPRKEPPAQPMEPQPEEQREEVDPPPKEQIAEDAPAAMEKIDEQAAGIESDVSAFFNVPVKAIEQLKERLEIILADREEEMVEGILTEYGFDCGRKAIENIDIKCKKEELENTLPDVWIGIGLSKVEILDVKAETIDLLLYELEIKEPCFLGGYMAGVVSGLIGEKLKVRVSEEEKGYELTLEQGLDARVKVEDRTMDIDPAKEKYLLEHGTSYIVSEKGVGFSAFREKVEHGWAGLCITREY